MSRRNHKIRRSVDTPPSYWQKFGNWVEKLTDNIFTRILIVAVAMIIFVTLCTSTRIGDTIFGNNERWPKFFNMLIITAFIVVIGIIAGFVSYLLALLIFFISEKIKTWGRKPWQREEEKKEERDSEPLRSQETQRKRRNSGIAGIVSLIMKADGITSRGEMKAAKNYLRSHYSPSDYKEIQEALEINMRINNPKFVKQSCIWLTANMNYSERLGFTEFLFDIARLSKGIDVGEWRLLNDIMKRICLEDEDIEYLTRKYSRDYSRRSNKKAKEESNTNELSAEVLSEPTHDPYLRILGLEGEATPDEIQSAYHKLAKKYHPDTVQDEEMKQILTEKFKEINLAYNALSK